jgi:steroid 5-alpha reductase family enzyme
MNPALFFVFNVVFICLAQSILLFLVSMPAYVMLLTSQITRRVDESDTVFARLVLALVTLEFFADQQQWSKEPCCPST